MSTVSRPPVGGTRPLNGGGGIEGFSGFLCKPEIRTGNRNQHEERIVNTAIEDLDEVRALVQLYIEGSNGDTAAIVSSRSPHGGP
jgi:hypothetical protein